MGIIDQLASIRVTPTTDHPSITYSSHVHNNAHPFRTRRHSIVQGKVLPLVSCLMVTRGDRWTIKYALESYRRQTYEKRELIIAVNRDNYEVVSLLVIAANIKNVTVFGIDHDLTLGDCRNMSIARARGEILVQWDDDDLYDPLRIAVSVSALIKTPSAAAMLSRWLVWWPGRDLAAISGIRIWEGSIAVWRECAPVYPNMSHGEDTYITECIANTFNITTIDAPLLYIYIVTGNNAFNTEHYEAIIAHANYVACGEEYHDLIEILSDRIPVLEYRAEMTVRS
jgi:glycosyltransferase involved in cell wall biosynthesis